MKKLLALLLLAPFVASEPSCDLDEPPVIEYEHYQIDDYLFTYADVSPYDSSGEWTDWCASSYFIATKPSYSKDFRPWYRQNVLFENSFRDVSFIGLMKNTYKDEEDAYAIFEGDTFGNSGPIVMVFMTSPEFKLVFKNMVNIDKEKISLNSFISSKRTENIEKCGDVSMATWPYDTFRYTFKNGEYTKQIIKEGQCLN